MKLLEDLEMFEKLLDKWPRKHVFDAEFPIGNCVYCEEKTGLSGWQLMTMPKSMAICEKGKRISIFEMIFGNYNCWEGYK